MGRTALTLLFAVVLSLAGTSLGTKAAWLNQPLVSGTTLSTATVDLRVQGSNTVTNFTAMNNSAMTPGSSVAGVLTVRNSGTIPLRYFVDAVATNPDGKGLAAALTVSVTAASSVTGSAPNRTCGGTALSDAATAFTSPFIGSTSSRRLLAAATQEYLCVQASLSADTATTMQTAATTVSFAFSAEGVPSSAWSDSVAVSGTSLGTATISTPTMTCGAELANKQVVVAWPAMPGATGYRLFYGTGGSQSVLLGANATSYPFKYDGTTVQSGTASVQAIYGSPAWTSGVSNTRTYYVDNTTASCS